MCCPISSMISIPTSQHYNHGLILGLRSMQDSTVNPVGVISGYSSFLPHVGQRIRLQASLTLTKSWLNESPFKLNIRFAMPRYCPHFCFISKISFSPKNQSVSDEKTYTAGMVQWLLVAVASLLQDLCYTLRIWKKS